MRISMLLVPLAFFAAQYSFIFAALKACEWQTGKKLFLDSFIFLAATVGAYFIYMPTAIYFVFHVQTPRYFFLMFVAYMTFSVGALTLWAIRKIRGGSVFDTRPSFAAFVGMVGFLIPIASLVIYSWLTYTPPLRDSY